MAVGCASASPSTDYISAGDLVLSLAVSLSGKRADALQGQPTD
jgi:hypothetical protein